MAGVADLNVRIGADISEVLSKVERVKAKLNSLTEEQGQLKDEIKNLNFSLRDNEKEYAKVATALQKVNTTTKEGRVEAARLRKELDSLGTANGQITTALKDNRKSLVDTTSQIKVHASELKKAESAGSGFASGATKVYSGLRKIAYIVPGLGIAGLISLIAGPLIDAFADWFEAIDNVSEAQKNLQANLKNYNDINEEANKNAGKQIATLKVLYEAATNVNLSMKDRLAAVKGLQNQFPDYFKNISQETILNGGAKKSYDELTDSIIQRAKAQAAIGKLEEIAGKQLDNNIKRGQVLIDYAKNLNKITSESNTLSKSNPSAQNAGILRSGQKELLAEQVANDLKRIDENNRSLKAQEDYIKSFIGLSDLAKAAETEIKPPKVAKEKTVKDIETIADVLRKLAIQIDFLNQKELLLKTDQSQAKIKAVESTIDVLMQKFKLLADNPVIIRLQAQAADVELQSLFKKDAAQRKDLKIDVPVEFKPEVQSGFQAFDSESYNLRQILKGLGVTKTKIGIPIDTANIKELRETLTETQLRLENMANFTIDTLSPAFDALFQGILSGSQNAFQSFGQALEQTIVQLGAAALKAAALALILSAIEPGLSFGGAFKKLTGFSTGGSVQGFSTGGPVWGAGTATSDSIPARLSKGEYVVRASKVKEFGLDFFNKINFGGANMREILRDKFGMMKFATGGFVSPNSVNFSRPISVPNISIGGGQRLEITGDFQLRNDRLVAAVKRGSAQINRNS